MTYHIDVSIDSTDVAAYKRWGDFLSRCYPLEPSMVDVIARFLPDLIAAEGQLKYAPPNFSSQYASRAQQTMSDLSCSISAYRATMNQTLNPSQRHRGLTPPPTFAPRQSSPIMSLFNAPASPTKYMHSEGPHLKDVRARRIIIYPEGYLPSVEYVYRRTYSDLATIMAELQDVHWIVKKHVVFLLPPGTGHYIDDVRDAFDQAGSHHRLLIRTLSEYNELNHEIITEISTFIRDALDKDGNPPESTTRCRPISPAPSSPSVTPSSSPSSSMFDSATSSSFFSWNPSPKSDGTD